MDLFDILQNRLIRDVSQEASSAGRRARDAGQSAANVTEQLERLTLICAAMWELLRESSSVTDEDLLAKIREVDLRDGRLDGQRSLDPLVCPECRRANNRRRISCLYCQAVLEPAGLS